jgi:uncharacterized integral membrane protein
MLFIIGLLLGAAAIIFVVQNITPVTVSFLGWSFDGSLAIVLLFALVGGMLISWLLSIPEMLRLSDLRKHNKFLSRELEDHKQKLSETKGKLSQAEAPVVLEKTVVIDR